jgi:hypothetical protein
MNWDYSSRFLPEECHTLSGFETMMDEVIGLQYLASPFLGQLCPRPYFERYILGVGLILRDLNHIHFSEEFEEDVPLYIGESEMIWARRQDLLDACQLVTESLIDKEVSKKRKRPQQRSPRKSKAPGATVVKNRQAAKRWSRFVLTTNTNTCSSSVEAQKHPKPDSEKDDSSPPITKVGPPNRKRKAGPDIANQYMSGFV